MRFIFIAYLILISVFQTSCTNNSVGGTNMKNSSEQLNSIVSQKKMMKIEGGEYEAFVGVDSGRIVQVASFYMDETPVTNAEYLDFLNANPQWTKSNVQKLYADENYLKYWVNDFEIPTNQFLESPVTNVSWYAAQAYAKSVGKRLPTIDEWEYVGLADAHTKNASSDSTFADFILKSYQDRQRNGIAKVKNSAPNFYGVYNMYDLVWEWTYDFNSVMISGESRNDSAPSESLFCAGAAVTSTDLRNYAAFVRYALRGSLNAKDCINNVGFRCVKN